MTTGPTPRQARIAVGQVPASVCTTTLDGDHGEVEGVVATCPRCRHSTESYGTSDRSVRRCLLMLNRECPRRQRNYYFDDGCSTVDDRIP